MTAFSETIKQDSSKSPFPWEDDSIKIENEKKPFFTSKINKGMLLFFGLMSAALSAKSNEIFPVIFAYINAAEGSMETLDDTKTNLVFKNKANTLATLVGFFLFFLMYHDGKFIKSEKK